MPIWPYAYTVNIVHEGIEYIYEFLRGSRLVTTSELDVCEDAISGLFESQAAAYKFIGVAVTENNFDNMIEGLFRVADSLQWVLPILLGCDLTSRFLYIGVNTHLVPKYFDLGQVFTNLWQNLNYVLMDWFVFMTDSFFDDKYSMAFWSGDMFYNIAVKNP